MNSAAGAEVDPSVCYRHPDRTSWTLCERCGRTICPECQILTPQGVRCPECVRETGGSVQWKPAGGSAKAATAKTARAQRARAAARRAAQRPRWQQVVLEYVRPGGSLPIVTWTIAVVTLALWVLGFLTGNLPQAFLAATVRHAEWIWTYATTAFIYPAYLSPLVIALFVINFVFLLFIAPGMERAMSRERFLVIFFAGTGTAAALSVLLGGGYSGFWAGLFALFGAYLISVWTSPPARNQMLMVLAVNLLLALVLGGIVAVLGGIAAGVGAGLLLLRADSRPQSKSSAPYLLLFGTISVLIAAAIVRGVVTVGL